MYMYNSFVYSYFGNILLQGVLVTRYMYVLL